MATQQSTASAPTVTPNFSLTQFHPFKRLPSELQLMIWELTSVPRVIEIKYNDNHGFYTPTKPPAALSVDQESRNSFKSSYSLSFSTLLHNASIVFNFTLDTLYLNSSLGVDLIPFIYSLKGDESANLQYLAIDAHIDEFADEWGPVGAMDTLQRATRRMPALKKVVLVEKLDEYWHEHGFPNGDGDMELMEEMSDELREYMWHELFHLDNEDAEDECQELPDYSHELDGFHAPETAVVFGWRRTNLPLQPFP